MRLGMSFDYAADPGPQLEAVGDLEAAGLDLMWVPEAYGLDAVSISGALAARTRRLLVGPGVLPVHTRTPALIAQTAAGLDAVSGGRAVLGLGTSGPGVVRGFHGVPFQRPVARLREVVEACRAVWAGAPPPGSRLKPLLGPPRPRIPIVLATMRPAAVALTAELAEGWYPLFCVPERLDEVWGHDLARGAAGRDPSLGPLRRFVSMHATVGDEATCAAAFARARADIALYVGGMGPRGANFYTEVVSRLGWAGAAARIQDLFLDGHRHAAAAAVPDDLLEALTLIGAPAAVAARLRALREAGVDTLVVRGLGDRPAEQLAVLRALMDAA